MADYAYAARWNKVIPAKRSRIAQYEQDQPPPVFFNQPRVTVPPSNYGSEMIKPEYLTDNGGFYGGFYSGFRPPLMDQTTSGASFQGPSTRAFPQKVRTIKLHCAVI